VAGLAQLADDMVDRVLVLDERVPVGSACPAVTKLSRPVRADRAYGTGSRKRRSCLHPRRAASGPFHRRLAPIGGLTILINEQGAIVLTQGAAEQAVIDVNGRALLSFHLPSTIDVIRRLWPDSRWHGLTSINARSLDGLNRTMLAGTLLGWQVLAWPRQALTRFGGPAGAQCLIAQRRRGKRWPISRVEPSWLPGATGESGSPWRTE
jgi:hypothetical protein